MPLLQAHFCACGSKGTVVDRVLLGAAGEPGWDRLGSASYARGLLPLDPRLHHFTTEAQGAGALLLQLAYLFTLHAVWRARTNWRFHGTYPPPTQVVALNTLKLLSLTTTTAFRKDADKFRRAAFPAGLAQVLIEDDFSGVL